METIYIDVYFLINFTVDALALHFASMFSKISTTAVRLITASAIGALYAVMGVLLIEKSEYMFIFAMVFLVLMVLITSKGAGLYRKIKYMIAVVVFNVIIGGLVYYGYCLLDKVFENGELEAVGGENKNILILSLFVLLSIGVLKLFISLFENTHCEKKAELIAFYNDTETHFEAFVDSGNLAVDPFDRTPVMLVNPSLSKKIFGFDAITQETFYNCGYELKKRIRIIPVAFAGERKILYGIKPDDIYIVKGKKTEKISLIIATDEKGESYGGYSALIPLSVLEGVRYEGN